MKINNFNTLGYSNLSQAKKAPSFGMSEIKTSITKVEGDGRVVDLGTYQGFQLGVYDKVLVDAVKDATLATNGSSNQALGLEARIADEGRELQVDYNLPVVNYNLSGAEDLSGPARVRLKSTVDLNEDGKNCLPQNGVLGITVAPPVAVAQDPDDSSKKYQYNYLIGTVVEPAKSDFNSNHVATEAVGRGGRYGYEDIAELKEWMVQRATDQADANTARNMGTVALTQLAADRINPVG